MYICVRIQRKINNKFRIFFFYFGYFKQENLHKGDTKPKTVRLGYENLTYEKALEILSRALNVKTLLGEVNL